MTLRAILNKSWWQHHTRHQLYGHLPPITKTIQVRRTRHAGHCWRSRDELISDVLLWTPTHSRAKAGRPARTYIQQLCEDTGCCPEDLPEAMNDREKWREKVRDIRATSTTWWWYMCVCVGHCWRSKDERISDVLPPTPSHRRAMVGRPTRTYVQQVCTDTRCSLENLPGAMDDRDERRKRVREISGISTTWWCWYVNIWSYTSMYSYLKLNVCVYMSEYIYWTKGNRKYIKTKYVFLCNFFTRKTVCYIKFTFQFS